MNVITFNDGKKFNVHISFHTAGAIGILRGNDAEGVGIQGNK